VVVVVVALAAFIDSTKPLLWLDVNTRVNSRTPCMRYVVKRALISRGADDEETARLLGHVGGKE